MVCIDSYWWMAGEGEGGRQGAGCVCVLEGGDQADNYRNNETHTHTSTHSCNQNILKKRVQVIDLVNRETQSDINQ